MNKIQQPVYLGAEAYVLGAILALGILIGAVVLCGAFASHAGTSTSNTGTTAANNTETSNSDTTNSAPPPTQHFKPNDTVEIGGIWQVAVSNVRTDPGGQFDSLKTGDIYVLVDVNFKNISTQEQQLFGDADWTLKDTAGQKYDNGFNSNASPPDGKVEPNDPAKGTLEFEVPSATKSFTLAFETNAFPSGQTIWDISVP